MIIMVGIESFLTLKFANALHIYNITIIFNLFSWLWLVLICCERKTLLTG